MSYVKYLSGLFGSISMVSEAEGKGIPLTRHENFDRLFKKELAIREGLIRRNHPVQDSIYSINDIDYRLAVFYAKYFSKIMGMYAEGYSFREVKALLKSMCREAGKKYITRGRVMLGFSDVSHSLLVDVYSFYGEDGFSIGDKDEFLSGAVFLLSFLGSNEENKKSELKWFGSYLFGVLNDIFEGNRAKPYTDNRKEGKLGAYLEKENMRYFHDIKKGYPAKRESNSGSGEIVEFNRKHA